MEAKVYKKLIGWLKLIPIVMMAAVLYAALFTISNRAMTQMSIQAGSSTATHLVFIAFYFCPYFKFCNFTKLCVLGLALNHILYLVGGLISYDKYSMWYTILSFSISWLAWLTLLFKDKKI